jgi:hypothetical protein
MKFIKLFLITIFCVSFFVSCGQTTMKNRMTELTRQLVSNLRNSDTTAILKMYDTSLAHINQKEYHEFIKEGVILNCELFNKLVDRHGMPDMKALTFSIDSTNGSNIAILPILTTNDTSLNYKRCLLYVMFYPERFFLTDKFLRFTIGTEEIIPRNRDIIKLPPFLKKGNVN